MNNKKKGTNMKIRRGSVVANIVKGAALAVLLGQASAATAQEFIEPFKIFEPEIVDRYKTLYEEAVAGAEFDPALGSLVFSVTDISIPGNSSLPVELTRWIPSDDLLTGGPSGWAWDIPVIRGHFMKVVPGSGYGEVDKAGWADGKNCSGTVADRVHVTNNYKSHGVAEWDYWEGITLHIPGKTTEKFLDADAGDARQYVTKSNYVVESCITSNSNGEEGFVVKGPDGTTYTFNHIRTFDSDTRLDTRAWVPVRKYTKLVMVTRVEDRFGNFVTYQYNANNDLEAIVASDGRRIDIGYEPWTHGYYGQMHRATYAEANGRRWEYHYGDETRVQQVLLPDGRSWQYSESIYRLGFDPDSSLINEYEPIEVGADGMHRVATCKGRADGFTIGVTNPEGVKTSYDIEYTYHGRSQVAPHPTPRRYADPMNPWAYTDVWFARNLNCMIAPSVVSKSVSGPGLPGASWSYSYSGNTGTYTESSGFNNHFTGPFGVPAPSQGGFPAVVAGAREDFRSVEVEGPEKTEVYYIDRRFQSPTEGRVIAEDTFAPDGSLVKRIEYVYEQAHFVGEHWYMDTTFDPEKDTPPGPPRDSVNGNQLQYRINKQKAKTTYYYATGNDVFEVAYNNYDDLGFAAETVESNNFSSRTRYTKQTYLHDEDNWVLGLPRLTQVSADGVSYTTTQEVTYHGTATSSYPDWNLPYEIKAFGTWIRRFPEYHTAATDADALGQLKRIEYNAKIRNAAGTETSTYRYQELSNYKRGKAQTITTAKRYDTGQMAFSRVVDDNGWVTRLTDLNGVSADYGYDAMGRLKYVDLPANWADVFVTWSHTPGWPSSERTQRTATRCTLGSSRSGCVSGTEQLQSVAEFDALYRILNTTETDLLNNLNRYQSFAYDNRNLLEFESYPSTSSLETQGVHSHYDALGRPTQKRFEDGSSITTEYLSGNRTRVTDGEGNITTMHYLAYGSPSRELFLRMDSPESVSTTQDVNLFGDVLSITQTGPGKNGTGTVSQTEYRAYDTRHHLCKVSRADVGTTVYSNNVLGEVQWQASGVSSSTTNTCAHSATASQKVSFVYDNLGAGHKVLHADDSPDITYTRDNNGSVLTQQAGSVYRDYAYNALGLVDSEQLWLDGKAFILGYQYDSLGNLSQLTYPDGHQIEYAPNAFGQPTLVRRKARPGRSAFTYASDITYHATGAIHTFNYGNGLSHTQTLDTLRRPEFIKDSRSGLVAVHLGYQYDNNSNLTALTDYVNGSYSLTSLTYDGLDRLTGVTGNTGAGSSTLQYDGLGNITYYASKNSVLDYSYASTGLLDSVSGTGTRAKTYSFAYDSRGNVTHNGHHNFSYNNAGQMRDSGTNQYVYDGDNRRVKSIRASGTEYSVYSHSGTLYYSEKAEGGLNYIYLGQRLIAKDGVVPENKPKQHFTPFGSSLEGELDDVGYTGHKFDTGIGLSYMQARYYDPVIGRFYSNDPIGFRDLHSFNRYAYANNNPYKFVDPTGMSAVFSNCVPQQEGGYKCSFSSSDQQGDRKKDDVRRMEAPAQDRSSATHEGGCAAPMACSGEEGGGVYDPLTIGSTLFTASGFMYAGENTFLGKGFQRISKTPITHEKMLLHNFAAKARTARALKAGGNVLGGVGYAVSAANYGVQMAEGNYRGARKAGVDMFMGTLMFAWPVGTVVGGVGLYVNNDYHSDPNNP